jgi:uncharacterized RmlC-like cupin family protein
MYFVKPAAIGSGLLALALLAVSTGAQAHDDDYGWKRKHHHHHRSPVYVVRERPVYYYREPRVMYAPPPYAYYPPGPPSLNINIPLQ